MNVKGFLGQYSFLSPLLPLQMENILSRQKKMKRSEMSWQFPYSYSRNVLGKRWLLETRAGLLSPYRNRQHFIP